MHYRDLYPSCAECPFLSLQQAQRDSTCQNIQDSKIHIAAKQAALEHYLDMSINISTYTLLQAMSAREYGAPEEQIQPLLDNVDAYDQSITEVAKDTEDDIVAVQTYIETSSNIIKLTDIIMQKVSSDCQGYDTVRYLGQKGCKSALVPFVDIQNK